MGMVERVFGAEESEPIIVVSGLPRSGTSLMMSMLGAGGIDLLYDDARPADGANPQGYFELEAVKRTARDASWVDLARGRAVKVVAPLLAFLPGRVHYKVLLMERDLSEVVASQNAMLRALDFRDGFQSNVRVERVLEQKLEETRDLLNHESHFEWISIDYAELVGDPFDQARRVATFLDIPDAAQAMATRVDPRLHRIRSRTVAGNPG